MKVTLKETTMDFVLEESVLRKHLIELLLTRRRF
jgi:hypothetical protein